MAVDLFAVSWRVHLFGTRDLRGQHACMDREPMEAMAAWFCFREQSIPIQSYRSTISDNVAIATVAVFTHHNQPKFLDESFSFHTSFITKSSNAAFTAPPKTGTNNQVTGLNVPQSNNQFISSPKESSQARPEKGRSTSPRKPDAIFASNVIWAATLKLVLKRTLIAKYSRTRLRAMIGYELIFSSATRDGQTIFPCISHGMHRTIIATAVILFTLII